MYKTPYLASVPPYGVYPPLITFFHEYESIDYESTLKLVHPLVSAGVTGPVLQGSNAEAPHLLHEERQKLVSRIRQHVTDIGHPQLPLIVGYGAPQRAETLVHISEANAAEADYAMVLTPEYWRSAISPSVLETFFGTIADASPFPILIYNYPDVVGGIDITSDTVIRLTKAHSNTVDIKLTCGDDGKADFLHPGLVAGSHGTIAGLANSVPALHREVIRQYRDGNLKEAQELQVKLSHADGTLMKMGPTGVKAVSVHYFGYGSGQGRSSLGTSTISSFPEDVRQNVEEVMSLGKAYL
ncbi:putative dihydrodipicolinate synthase [Aspergillus pseudocaelatus]|uniref:Dihydrodipicolinate synthase n=1 Tax=Aspergillus pseudocaelatus TaxID=1825620 RepID=A0ABQ6WK58_9EURO|nr:putative dihydrodipicolinate synthase [Aspergillus pseudocaelatus]